MFNNKLKLVVLQGPDHNGAFESFLKELEAIYTNSEDFLVVGGRRVGFTTSEITSTLHGRIDKDTTIIIAAHGNLNKRFRFHEVYISNPRGYLVSTKSILSDLDKLSTEPVHIIVDSCYSGTVLGEVKALKTGSTLTTFSDTRTPSNEHNSKHLTRYLKENYNKKISVAPAQAFLDNFQHYVSSNGFSVSLGNNENPYIYTFKPFENCTLEEDTPYIPILDRIVFKHLPLLKKGDALVRSCIAAKEQNFIQSYKNSVDSNATFTLSAEQMSDEDQACSLGTYIDFMKFFRGKYQKYVLVDFLKDPKHKGIIKKLQSSNDFPKIKDLESMVLLLKAGFKYDDPIFMHTDIKLSIKYKIDMIDKDNFLDSIISYLQNNTEEIVALDINSDPDTYEDIFVRTLGNSNGFIKFFVENAITNDCLSCLDPLLRINFKNYEGLISIAAEVIKYQKLDLFFKALEEAMKIKTDIFSIGEVIKITGIDAFVTSFYGSLSSKCKNEKPKIDEGVTMCQNLIKDEVMFKDILIKALKANNDDTFMSALFCGLSNNFGGKEECLAPEITYLLNPLQTSDDSQPELSGEQQNMDL